MKKPTPAAEKQTHHDELGMERLIFFSDAVFAIAITLLALEIRLPAGVEPRSEADMLALLLGMWQRYLAYIISFLVIGVMWIAHHRKFRLIRRYDRGLLMLNLLLLMIIAFIPFPSSLISEYSGSTVTIFYALTIAFANLFMALIWAYATHNHRLTLPNLDPKTRVRHFINPIATAAIFILSLTIIPIDADLSKFAWLLILPISMINKDE